MGDLNAILKEMNKKGIWTSTEGAVFDTSNRLRFPSATLNYMTYGGIPRGRMMRLGGVEGSGKTTLAYAIMGQYIRDGEDQRKILYLDTENAYDVQWAMKQGVTDPERVIVISQTEEPAELLLEYVLNLMDTGDIGLVVLDSLDGLVPDAVMKKDIAGSTIGALATVATKFYAKAKGVCAQHEMIFITISQVREKVNSPWGGLDTSGGRMVKHAQSITLFLTGGSYFDDGFKDVPSNFGFPRGKTVTVQLKKIRCAPPDRKVGTYTINFVDGVDREIDLFEMALVLGFIEQSGAWYQLFDPETGEQLEKIQGKGNCIKRLKEDRDLFDKLDLAVYNKSIKEE